MIRRRRTTPRQRAHLEQVLWGTAASVWLVAGMAVAGRWGIGSDFFVCAIFSGATGVLSMLAARRADSIMPRAAAAELAEHGTEHMAEAA